MTLVGHARPEPRVVEPVRPAGTVLAWLLLALIALILVVGQGARMASPPGMSHDGQNLGVFALGSRGLRTDGPIESHLGADLSDGMGTYANHPPLIYWSIAASESLLGERPWATRLPTILAALAVIPLLYSVIRRGGISPVAAAVGVAVAASNPLFAMYGWIPDTPMLALPFALGTVLAWQRHREQPDGRRLAVLMAVAALTCLAGWQGFVLCAAVLVAAAVDGRRTRSWTTPLALGAAIGVTVTLVLAWAWWSYGSLAPLTRSATQRSGGASDAPSIAGALRTQATFLTDNWRVPVLLATPIGFVLAWRRTTTRWLLVMFTGVVVVYAAVLWQAATVHRYWTLWAVAPVALCLAALCQEILDRSAPIARRPWILVVVAVAVAAASVARTSPAQDEFDLGRATRPAVDAPLAAGQRITYALGMVDPRWTTYTTHRPVEILKREGLADLVAAHPDWRVLLNCDLQRLDHGPPPCSRLDDPDAVWGGLLVATRADAALAALNSR
jgi:hypothetical protein